MYNDATILHNARKKNFFRIFVSKEIAEKREKMFAISS